MLCKTALVLMLLQLFLAFGLLGSCSGFFLGFGFGVCFLFRFLLGFRFGLCLYFGGFLDFCLGFCLLLLLSLQQLWLPSQLSLLPLLLLSLWPLLWLLLLP